MNNMPKKKSNKHSKQRSKIRPVFIIVPVVLLVICLLVYGFRSTVVSKFAPFVASLTTGRQLQSLADDELTKLGGPFRALGFSDVKIQKAKCTIDTQDEVRVGINCQYTAEAYREMPKSEQEQATLVENATKLQKVLKANGWDGEYSSKSSHASLEEIIGNVTKGIDYTPDAYYYKQVGDMNCTFDTITAFSKPKTPAVSTRFDCYKRTIYPFGEPINISDDQLCQGIGSLGDAKSQSIKQSACFE